MMILKSHLDWFFIILIIVAVNEGVNSRYIHNKNTENELSKHKTQTTTANDDIDLETFVQDYYDDLWHYLDTWDRHAEEAKKKEKSKKKESPGDYDYMSDMAVPETEVDENKFKNFIRSSIGGEKENFTWPFSNDSFQNRSSGDAGIPDAVRAYRESNSQEDYPLRSKEMRLQSIIDQVLSFRGGSPKINETIPDAKQYNALREIYEKNIKRIKNEEWTSSYTEKVQSFYPSCEIPRNTDEDVWADPHSMNLLFDLDYPSPQEDSTIMIVSAKLRLYKLPQENYSLPNTEGSSVRGKSERLQNSFGLLTGDDDRQIRVSVYWYTRSLRRHRIKKKLLDSQMLSVYTPKWVEFNIRPAVRTWKESGRNFGLVVNVEDEDGVLLPADQYIHAMNCSKWTVTVRPIPSIVMDRVNQYFIENISDIKNETGEDIKNDEEKHKIYPYQPLLYPIIDLCTREVPNSDVRSIALVDSAKKALESKILNLPQRGFNAVNDSISIFLKKNNLDIKEISKLSRVDKSVSRKSETKNGEGRVSYFQNVPIGSPSVNPNGNTLSTGKTHRETSDNLDIQIKSESLKAEVEEEREMPRIRHSRKQWDSFQKPTNSNYRLRNDSNVTDHH